MKIKNYIFSILLLLFPVILYAQAPLGNWSGILTYNDVKIGIEFVISQKNGLYYAFMNVPEQNIKSLPLTSINVLDKQIELKQDKLGLSFKGTIVGDTLLTGTFLQNGISIPLSLRKENIALNRPQEPKPPFPYESLSVDILNSAAGITLSGTLTIPCSSGSKKFPAVILLSGSGPQDRNEEIYGHKPFLVMADYLSRNGIAVLRYDDRGVGKSTGNFARADAEDFTSDALSAFDYLRKRGDIDHRKTGMLGHSEGGLVAFMSASKNKNIAFIVSMAGPALRGDSILLMQNRDILIASGLDELSVHSYVNVLRKIFAFKQTTNNMDSVKHILFTDEEKALLPDDWKNNAMAILSDTSTVFKHFIECDPQNYIVNVKCPVFALNGEKDLQVRSDINLRSIKNYLSAAGNKKITIKAYKGLNHLFQNSRKGLLSEYGQIEETISNQVLIDICNWINTNFKSIE